MVPVRIVSAAVDPGNSAVLRARIEVDGASASHNADIYGAVALVHAESQVLRGENSGKHLAGVYWEWNKKKPKFVILCGVTGTI